MLVSVLTIFNVKTIFIDARYWNTEHKTRPQWTGCIRHKTKKIWKKNILNDHRITFSTLSVISAFTPALFIRFRFYISNEEWLFVHVCPIIGFFFECNLLKAYTTEGVLLIVSFSFVFCEIPFCCVQNKSIQLINENHHHYHHDRLNRSMLYKYWNIARIRSLMLMNIEFN